jgi:hypothetical protein
LLPVYHPAEELVASEHTPNLRHGEPFVPVTLGIATAGAFKPQAWILGREAVETVLRPSEKAPSAASIDPMPRLSAARVKPAIIRTGAGGRVHLAALDAAIEDYLEARIGLSEIETMFRAKRTDLVSASEMEAALFGERWTRDEG